MFPVIAKGRAAYNKHRVYMAKPLRNHDFRVLRVLPSRDFNSLIKCDIEIWNLETIIATPPAYKAVSSRWRDHQGCIVEILLRFGSMVWLHPVLDRVGDILRQIRDTSESVYVWIGVLCIMHDREEAVMQHLLPAIFRRATETVIWPGNMQPRESGDYSNAAFEFVPNLCRLESITALQTQSKITRCWNDFVSLLSLPYFSRRWVFLEIIISTHPVLYYGDQRINWMDFCDAVISIRRC